MVRRSSDKEDIAYAIGDRLFTVAQRILRDARRPAGRVREGENQPEDEALRSVPEGMNARSR